MLPQPSPATLALLNDPELRHTTKALGSGQRKAAGAAVAQLEWGPPCLLRGTASPPLPAFAASDPSPQDGTRQGGKGGSKGKDGGKRGGKGKAAARPKAALASLKKAA